MNDNGRNAYGIENNSIIVMLNGDYKNQTAANDSYSRHCEERSNPVFSTFFWIASLCSQ